jgi:tetratricopeptide (TPR) repeat protein
MHLDGWMSAVRTLVGVVLGGLFCVVIAALVVSSLVGIRWGWTSTRDQASAVAPQSPAPAAAAHSQTYPDPNAPGTAARIFVERKDFDGDISTTVARFARSLRDPKSIDELREALRGKGRRGIAALRAEYDRLSLDSPPTLPQAVKAIPLARSLAFLYMYEGKFTEATTWLDQAMALSKRPEISPDVQASLHALQAVSALRRGEIENCLECVGPSSCIFPLEPEAVHRQQSGSREAIKHFTAYLEWAPGDLQARWLLNLAYMTVGEYPDHVPAAFLIPPDTFRSKLDIGRFENVAPLVGLGVRGPNLAGGSVFDDFTGDDLPDLFVTSIDVDLGASLYVNRGNGTFEDHSAEAGLNSQIYVLNLARADFDNDGKPDVVLLRGAWDKPSRLSLLRNKGDGVFEDVTVAAGLDEPISSESAVWGDYDNDGRVDLFVCGEFHADSSKPSDVSRLYHNEGNGKFKDVAESAGIHNEFTAKGSAWGDYDGDGRIDLFVSNHDGPCRLYHNDGNGTFKDVAPELGLTGPAHERSFACWFWDYDNDGRLDLFVNDYYAFGADTIVHYLGLKGGNAGHPHLYKNLGEKGFRDVSEEVGLDWPITAMGANFGDVDNDGYLDVYFGTGGMAYAGLVPNVMIKNIDGRRFEDVTDSSRTGHLQKGHGVSFADWDCDGDLDLFSVLGGACPGDQSFNVLFQNPGHHRRWLKIKLVGRQTNRSAIGAQIHAELKGPDGKPRSIYRTIGNNGSFGGNSLVETIGMGDAKVVDRITVSWPVTGKTQVFSNVDADQFAEITEGTDSLRVIHQEPLSVPPPPG